MTAALPEYARVMRREIALQLKKVPPLLAGLLCVACTRDNPAFDLIEGGTDDQGDGDSSTTTDMRDLPEAGCQYQPAEGLSIHVGAPENFGGTCATGVTIGGRLESFGGGNITVEACEPGCMQCYGTFLDISAFPMLIDSYIPAEVDKCVSVEAEGPLGEEPGACHFGSLTIYDLDVPFMIATTHSFEATTVGRMRLGSLIPDPLKGVSCGCDDIGQGNDCCYTAMGPPEFWYYPFQDEELFAGQSAPIDIPNQSGIVHAFKVIQAQVLHSCESHDLQTSWAVVAEI